MTITKQTVADQIAAYLHHEITPAQLVDWEENAMMEGELAEPDARTLAAVIARLGVADVRAFGLAWEDCEELLHKLGFPRAWKWSRREPSAAAARLAATNCGQQVARARPRWRVEGSVAVDFCLRATGLP